MKWLSSLVIAGIVIAGCADKEMWNQYYAEQSARTQAIIASVEKQGKMLQDQQAQEMQFFANASSNAAKTASPADDTLVAFAWGYRMGQPRDVTIPTLPLLKAPDTSADLVRAWTPIAGMVAPFLYPLAYGWANNDGSSYTATDNAKINIQSENAGSLNTAGGDQQVQTTDQRIQIEDDCIDCGGDGAGLNFNSDEASIDPVSVCPGTDIPGVSGPDGTYWVDFPGGCSCESRQAGRC